MIITETFYTDRPIELADDRVAIRIGAFSIIEASEDFPVHFEAGATIGHHCCITSLASVGGEIRIGANVTIDSKCHIYRGVRIGSGTQILYGAKVFELVTIGDDCIIGSDVANWTTIGDRVTFMGLVAHSNRRVANSSDWNTAPHPSPQIEDGAFVGERSLLIGGITISEGAYVAAGEVVRCNIPPRSLYMKSTIVPLTRLRGFVSTGTK
jgi:acetyltransferase-like isoleucine patch superfamily enzyme